MRRVSYREIGGPSGLLANREPFTGNSMSGYRHADGSYDVYSYRTLVASYNPEADESWVSDNHWGKTTARHLGLCRAWLPRVRSNDPSALDGIGPGCRVRCHWQPEGPFVADGRVVETHPLANAVRVREGDGTVKAWPREWLVLA